jgi:hypothetical protein
MDKVVEFYFNARRGSSFKNTRKPLSEVIELLCSEICSVEVSLLEAIEFDLEFDLPLTSVRSFRKNYGKEVLQSKVSVLES